MDALFGGSPSPPPPPAPVQMDDPRADLGRLARQRRELERRRKTRSDLRIDPATSTGPALETGGTNTPGLRI